MEEVHTSDNKKVFSFINRGNETEVAVDYEQEKKLTESEALHAMHICPTGAILVKGKSLPRPIGDRKYDIIERDETVLHEKSTLLKHGKEKFRVATTSLAGCFGCHMSLLDIDEELMDIVEIADFHRSPVTDIKEFTERCHVGIIEGGCCNSDNVEVLKEFREKCDVLIAMGECAIWGGLPAMRNTVPLEECLKEAYLNSMTSTSLGVIPEDEDLPKILDQVYPCNEIVHIDYYVPGCPPSAKHIWQVVKNILLGETYSIAGSEFKYD
jgi:[NiFe] hydrogenase diaphorase moiety small subunit